MKLYLTHGFDGDYVNFFGNFETVEELGKTIVKFRRECCGMYSFSPWETVTKTSDGTVIDFGDHSFFLKVVD